MTTFTCTHGNHVGDREAEGVPFGPRGEEWCQACFFFEGALHTDEDLDHAAGLTVLHACGHKVHYPGWDRSSGAVRRRARHCECPDCDLMNSGVYL